MPIKNLVGLFFLFGVSEQTFACDLPEYYGRSELEISLEPNGLKDELHRVLTWQHIDREKLPDLIVEACPENSTCIRHQMLTYKRARQFLFGFLHLEATETIENEVSTVTTSIRDVYCQREFRDEDFPEGKEGIPDLGTLSAPSTEIPFHEILNTEHTWPRSRFNKSYDSGFQDVDLHHLFPSDQVMNSTRGNYPFCEVEESLPVKCESCKLGYSKLIDGVNEAPARITDEKVNKRLLCFEPSDAHKGNVARALFYFATRYRLNIEPQEEYFLRKWHELDPVDEFEKDRNSHIYEIQKTRNPYIDNPGWVALISDF